MADLSNVKQEEPDIIFLQFSGFIKPLIVFGGLICLSVYFNRASWEHLTTWEYVAFGFLLVPFLLLFLLRTRMFLKFDKQALTLHYVTGSERKIAWTDITKVGVVFFRRPAPMVVLRLRDDSPSLSVQRFTARPLGMTCRYRHFSALRNL